MTTADKPNSRQDLVAMAIAVSTTVRPGSTALSSAPTCRHADLAEPSSWDVNSSLNFETGWTHLFKGEFAKNAPKAPDHQDVDYFYVQSLLRL